MGAEVGASKPNAKKPQIYKDINARIRNLIDRRPFWSALLSRTVINIPAAYVTGSVTFTTGSTAVTGTATAWPVTDVVNTTMVAGNRSAGYQEIAPAGMTGIGVETLLCVNDGIYTEIAPVVEVTNSTFVANFQFPHNDGTPLTTSSLAGLQFRMGPNQAVYTLLGAVTATTGIVDMPFGGASLVNAAYALVRAYVTIDPNLKDIISAWDPVQGCDLAVHVSQSFLQVADPQRNAQGNPQCLVDLSPSVAGSMQFELWPYQTIPYAIPVLYAKQWPELKRPTDKPPYFINPSVIIDGATADSLRRKDIRSDSDKDPYYDPQLANVFDQKYLQGALMAAMADEGKCLQSLSQDWRGVGRSASYRQNHISQDSWW